MQISTNIFESKIATADLGRKVQMFKIIAWVISALIFILLLVFSMNNLDQTTLNFFGGMSITVPMIVLVLIVFAAGCVFGMLAMLPFAWRRRKQIKNATKAMAKTTDTAPASQA